MNEFIKGHQGNLSNSDEVFVNEIKETLISKGWSFLRKSMQWSRNLFTSISFRGRKLTWNQLPPSEIIGPYTWPTDFGSCCLYTKSQSSPALFLYVTRDSVRELRTIVRPAAWVITGDLTDAKTKDYSGSRQYEEEWEAYRGVVEEAGDGAVWLDIRGNHDNFDVPHPGHR